MLKCIKTKFPYTLDYQSSRIRLLCLTSLHLFRINGQVDFVLMPKNQRGCAYNIEIFASRCLVMLCSKLMCSIDPKEDL